ncbi:disks large-associated protein 2 isoform X1 [Narcine bancroftii]|uniref:disks large-associated protein 2 isoform X1 n=2 Tax=Narcine bancroftii TaxID=1343680 RepID=UPI0038315032
MQSVISWQNIVKLLKGVPKNKYKENSCHSPPHIFFQLGGQDDLGQGLLQDCCHCQSVTDWRRRCDSESQCTLCGEQEDQQFSWSPSHHFNEGICSPSPRTMKGLTSSRTQPQLSLPHTCGLVTDECQHSHDHLLHGLDSRPQYLLSPTDSCQVDHHRCSPRSSIHSECVLPVVSGEHVSSSTFPRMHYTSHYDSRDDCTSVSYTGSKINRIPANLLDQFEKQLPLHRDGFHTLQYQRASTAAEPRSESPGRIRHLVHSVQKLFTKSHSLEGASKGNANGTRGEGRHADDHHHSHHPKHGKRSKSKERKPEPKHKSAMSAWWSSDDNLDSDSNYRASSALSKHHMDHISQYYPEGGPGAFSDLTLKTSKSNNDVKCSACEAFPMAAEGKYMKRSSWSTLTVSQAKEAYRKSSLNLERPLVHQEIKSSLRPCHYLQVPQDEWGGYPLGSKDEEIPCRRMRSGSYIKAMGDEESGESDTSPKGSPKSASLHETLMKAAGQKMDTQNQSYLQSAIEVTINHSLDPSANENSPKFRSRNQSYMRAVSTLSQASCVSQVSEAEVNGQFESVCESVFGEIESQAVDALDLPGCFRTRSHSYLRAIQAGYSQDDDCIPSMSSTMMASSIKSTTVSCTHYKKTPPPVPPRTTSKPVISVTAQSSTESTQDAYHENRSQRSSPWPQEGKVIYNSTDSLDSAKAVNMALESVAAQHHGISHSKGSMVLTRDKAILTLDVAKAQQLLKNRRSSIGIQVDAVEPTDSDTDSRGLREYHSVGVQVEDEKRHGRFKRSNSVTASVQADLEMEGFPGPVTMEDKALQFGSSFQRHSEPSTPTQYTALRTVRTQGLLSYREDYRAPLDTSNFPPPDPWLETTHPPVETGRVSPCRRDGHWFMKLLHAETKRMEGWCKQMEREAEENDLSEETLGKIRSAVGSAQLLMSQKFQQFYWLCQQNLDPSAMPRPTSQDLAGFWDLLQLSIEDVSMKFDELHQLKANDWKPLEPPEKQEEKKIPPPVPKKPPKGKIPIVRENSLDLPDRQRQEARKRLMAAKRAASFRQNSATERADSIEIYIPEAQTRL